MPAPFPVTDVTEWPVDRPEPGGQDANLWLIGPGEDRWLFKPVVMRHGRRQGEDWAEKIAAELARLLSLPAARVEMAQRDGIPGSVSRDLKPPDSEMQTGGVLIQGIYPQFEPKSKDRRGHSLRNIKRVLEGVAAPAEFDGHESFDAFDVFVGYLVFDALVANRDRHEDNWSVFRDRSGELSLSASYDHGSSLGFGETDGRRTKILAGSPGIEHWARRGTAWRFEGAQRTSLVDFAASAVRGRSATVRKFWLQQVDSLTCDSWNDVIAATPVMSEVSRRFCAELLGVNRRRILDAC